MKKKSAIINAIILMFIDFASISTTLIINGNAIGTTAFSTKDNVYSTSLVKSYVEEYLQKLSLFNLDILNITAKLIEKKNRKGLLIMEIIYRQDFL